MAILRVADVHTLHVHMLRLLFCFVATLVRNMRVRVARRVRGGDGGRCRIMNYTKLRLSFRNKVRTAASF